MRHTRIALCFLSLLFATAALAQNGCPPGGSLSFPVTLTGTAGAGGGFLTLNPANNTGTVQLNTVGLGLVTSVALATSGTTVAFPGTLDPSGNFTSTVSLTPQQLNAILANPAAYTVTVTTPNGPITGALTNNLTLAGTFTGTGAGTAAGGSFSATVAGNTLYYTFTPVGLGNSFTGLTLSQGNALFIPLSNGGTLTNGRFTGSVPITSGQAQALLANPGNFNVTATTAEFPIGAARATLGVTPFEQWFPVAGRVRGAGGSQWTTDVIIYSPTGALVTVEVFPSAQNNATAGGSMLPAAATTVGIPARNTATLTDVTGALANFSGLGALRVTSDRPVVAVERIYDAASTANAGGLAAQPISARTMCDAVANGILAGLISTTDVRTNVGFFNANAVTATVQFDTVNELGRGIGNTQTLTLQPYQLVQMPVVGGLTNGAISFRSNVPLLAYSSVVSNGTGDSHVTFARPDTTAPLVALSDVAAITIAANQAELTEVQYLLSHSLIFPSMSSYVVQMLNDHSAALNQAVAAFAAAGITPSTNNPTATAITAQAQQDITTLAATDGSVFAKTYFQMQVAEHQRLLQLLDTVLIPSAAGSSQQVITMLQQLRVTTAQHLAMAQQALATLG